MRFTRKAHQVVWTPSERLWGERLGWIIRATKVRRTIERLEGMETDEEVLREVLDLIPEPRTHRKPIKNIVARLERLKKYEGRINPKWAGEMQALRECKVFYARVHGRGQWKPSTKRLTFEELRVTYDGRLMDVYSWTANKIKKRLESACCAMTNWVW